MAEKLFFKQLVVQVRNGDRDERRSKLQLQLELCIASASLQKKQLVVQLTDEQDLVFLYTLKIDEEDFQNLKVQQGLLVDFASFPQKFIELLQLCLGEEAKDVPKFVMQLVVSGCNGAHLNIVETNPFKHLVHLSLKLACGTDADIKKHLADCLRTSKDKSSVLESRLLSTETGLGSALKQTEELLGARTAELDKLRVEWQARLKEIEAAHVQELAEERQRSLKAQSAYQQKHEQERRDLEQAHIKIAKQLEARVYELDMANKDLTDRKYKSEASLHELRSRLAALDEENGRLKQEQRRLRDEAAAREADVQRLDKQTAQLGTQLAVVEQQVKDKEQLLTRSSELLLAEQQQKRKLEEEVTSKQQQLTKYETSIKTMSDEILKANEIIRKLQAENKNTQAKVKLRSHIALEQEKLLGERERQLDSERLRLQQAQDAIAKHAEEAVMLKGKLTEAEKHLEEARELNRTNENVINWLNKQINESQLHHRQLHHQQHRISSSPAAGSSRSGGVGHQQDSGLGLTPTATSTAALLSTASSGSAVQHYAGPTRLPQPLAKSTPTLYSGNDKENSDTPLDSKYLQRNEAAMPLRSINTNAAYPVPQTTTPMNAKPAGGRLNQQMPQPPATAVRSSQPAVGALQQQQHGLSNAGLASAYFPKVGVAVNGAEK